ncbi:MAG: ABC transporter ATP-binding protein, partial [Pseudomonadota bacterium]
MSGPALRLDAVEKVYGEGDGAVRAVRDFTLAVEPGEIVALLGSSGCGKTSTLRMIAGFEETTRGRIVLQGREVQTLPPAKRNVAMAFEGYSLYPPLTIRENVAFALKAQRLKREEIARRVDEIAALLEIEDLLDRRPAGLSGGQQQRVSLGRALVREADLHLLDEPMGQLEPQLRAALRGRIKHFLKERGLTTILVTHDQTEANALADRIAVMEAGVLQQFDAPDAIKARPANLFTGAFIGEPPM